DGVCDKLRDAIDCALTESQLRKQGQKFLVAFSDDEDLRRKAFAARTRRGGKAGANNKARAGHAGDGQHFASVHYFVSFCALQSAQVAANCTTARSAGLGSMT